MPTATDFDTDVDQALLISHDFAPRCEADDIDPAAGCGHPAEVICYLRCGCVWLFSWECRNREVQAFSKLTGAFDNYKCRRCHYKFGTISCWQDIAVREVPL